MKIFVYTFYKKGQWNVSRMNLYIQTQVEKSIVATFKKKEMLKNAIKYITVKNTTNYIVIQLKGYF